MLCNLPFDSFWALITLCRLFMHLDFNLQFWWWKQRPLLIDWQPLMQTESSKGAKAQSVSWKPGQTWQEMKTGGWRNKRLAVYWGQTLGKNTYSDSGGVIGDSGLSHRPLATDVEPIYATFTVNIRADGWRAAKLTAIIITPIIPQCVGTTLWPLVAWADLLESQKKEVMLSSPLSGHECSNDMI